MIFFANALNINGRIELSDLLKDTKDLGSDAHVYIKSGTSKKSVYIDHKGKFQIKHVDIQNPSVLGVFSRFYEFSSYYVQSHNNSFVICPLPSLDIDLDTFTCDIIGSENYSIKPLSKKIYQEQQSSFGFLSFLMNPMILMTLFSVGAMYLMPKLMNSLDPEDLAEMRKKQKDTQNLNIDISQSLANIFSSSNSDTKTKTK
ncbi:hypothetical protein ROZALSC1DRAFT_30691 [Rozella allomycis CSF55]|uniref:ER membrane protein complex subunit 7 beta-sandwich domain-containing protein n=1 Tax=Rozella allomycis (strain CSF55) TaxID=988480 RepID=A0A4P9YEH6_ROZAC|nr:hypothetical protein ROZALSC1DRAFT_30691 [Rozella allomycis CSF55]